MRAGRRQPMVHNRTVKMIAHRARLAPMMNSTRTRGGHWASVCPRLPAALVPADDPAGKRTRW
jgi:hypothetical protein